MAFTFGSTTQPAAQPQTNSLFGGAAANNTATAGKPSFSFGGSTNNNAQTQPAPGSSSLFGNAAGGNTGAAPNSAPPTGGGLFGNNTGSHQQTTGGGLFGNNNTQQQQTGGGGWLFGNAGGQQQQSTGLFGSQQQPAGGQAGSIFGNNNAGAKPGLFGASSTSTQQPAQGGSLFGQSQAGGTSTGGGLFGQSQTQQQPQQNTGLFGSTQNQQSGGSLFGSMNQQPTGGLFGSTNQQPPAGGGIFASTSQPTQSSMMASTSNLAASQTTKPLFAPKQEKDMQTRITEIKNSWNPQDLQYRFKYYFYNVVEPGTAGRYGRPQSVRSEEEWTRVQRENPDPNSMVPVAANGWEDIQKRMQFQENIASVHQEKVKELSTALIELSRDTSIKSSIRSAALQSQLITLQQRLIHVTAKMAVQTGSFVSSPQRSDEIEMKAKLDNVHAELEGRAKPKISTSTVGINSGTPRRRAAGEGRMMGQVNELWGNLEQVKRRNRASIKAEGWLSDENALSELASILQKQQFALQKLKALVDGANDDAEVIRDGLEVVATSTLRR